ncbi:MAG: MFS transporter [Actinomycetia bacterium]|nr:MFS transporter [Actinomycetes bacterium]
MLKSVYRPYADALKVSGAAKFSAAGFVARMPLAMIGLGILLFISNTTGSYAFAGFLQALFAITAALAAVISSRMSDRYGQRIILVSLSTAFSVSLFLFVYSVSNDFSRIWQALLAVLAGATFPAYGSYVRTRWAYVVGKNQRTLHSAFAWESILDELIFTIGPLFAVALAFNVSFASPILVGAIITLGGALVLASMGGSAPPPVARKDHQDQGSAIRHQGMTSIALVAVGIGILFGTFDVAVVAFMQEAQVPQLSGVTLALWAASSLIGGFVYGSRHFTLSLPQQLIFTTLAVTVVVFPLAFIHSTIVLMAAAALSGFAIAPTLIATFSLTQRLVPSKLLTEGLTWTNSGLAAGFALGASLSGVLVDRLGTSYAFGLGTLGAALALTSALTARERWLRAMSARIDNPATGIPLPLPLNQDPIPGPAPGAFLDETDSR